MLDYGQNIVHGKVRNLFKSLFAAHTPKEVVVIGSRTSFDKAYDMVDFSDIHCRFCTSEQVPFEDYLYRAGQDRAEVYVGFGGGTAIDIAKYLAKKNDAQCIAIPSMLSTNVFATDKVAEITPEGKFTTLGVLPSAIWIDESLLMLSKEQNLYGFADVFSIGTALQDWLLAEEQKKDSVDMNIYQETIHIMFDAMDLVEKYGRNIPSSSMFDVICRSGYVTNKYGSGRPESGSEHILAKEIEKLINVPHGLAVTCGIAIMTQVQPVSMVVTKLLPDTIKRLGLYDEVKRHIEKDVLYKAISNVKPRPDRYTIIDYHSNLDKDFFVNQADYLIEKSGLYD